MPDHKSLILEALGTIESRYRSGNGIDTNTDVLNLESVGSEALIELQDELGYELSPELNKLYLHANGSLIGPDGDHTRLFATHHFNSIQMSLSTIRHLKEFNRTARQSEYDEGITGRLYNDYYSNHKLGAIQHMEFNPHWFPLGSTNGMSTYIMVDHAPGKNGIYGQVIFIDLRRKAIVLADSLTQYLTRLAKQYSYASRQEDDYKVMLRLAKKGFWNSVF